jgi:hypothetical protein
MTLVIIGLWYGRETTAEGFLALEHLLGMMVLRLAG